MDYVVETVIDRPLVRASRHTVKALDTSKNFQSLSNLMKALIESEAAARLVAEELSDLQYIPQQQPTEAAVQMEITGSEIPRAIKAVRAVQEACECIRRAQAAVRDAKECLIGQPESEAGL